MPPSIANPPAAINFPLNANAHASTTGSNPLNDYNIPSTPNISSPISLPY